jgi:TrmH family RNA methyltransferase
MGAVFRVPIEHAELPAAGPARVALVAGAERPLWQIDLRPATVFVVGAERLGLPDEIVAACEHVAAVPQALGADSLNAASAATVALYEAVRQRSAGG